MVAFDVVLFRVMETVSVYVPPFGLIVGVSTVGAVTARLKDVLWLEPPWAAAASP